MKPGFDTDDITPITIEHFDLTSLIEHRERVESDLTVECVYRSFEKHRREYVAVVKGTEVLGLCSRSQIGLLLGSRFGYPLYQNRPISSHLLPDPLFIQQGTPLLEALNSALSRAGEAFYDDICMVDSRRGFLGIISMQSLVRLQTRLMMDKIRLSTVQQQDLAQTNRELFRSVNELRQSRGRYDILFENSSLGVALLNSRGEVETANRRLRVLLGIRESEGGHSSDDLLSFVVPADRDRLKGLIQAQDASTDAVKTFSGEFSFSLPGRGNRLFKLFTNRINETGQICLCMDDISEQRALERQMAQKEKSALLESLVGGIAHEINNRLSPVVGYAELILMSIEDNSDIQQLKEYCITVRDNAMESGKIIRQLLQLSKPSTLELSTCDLPAMIKEATTLLKFRTREIGAEIQCVFPENPSRIQADASQLKQVMVNLLINALDAMENASQRLLKITIKPLLSQWEISVTDTGHGIKPEHLNRIFDPFFTTKSPHRGTGLGLSVCFSIIRQHGGEILVQSNPGKGTTFRILLPSQENPIHSQTTIEAQKSAPPLARRYNRALVVDDEKYITGFVQEALRSKMGYRVDWAVDGKQAVDLLQKNDFNLIVSDIRMPVMNGVQLYEWLLSNKPDLAKRFFFITGDAGGSELWQKVEELNVPVLRKPFGLNEFMRQCESVSAGSCMRQ